MAAKSRPEKTRSKSLQSPKTVSAEARQEKLPDEPISLSPLKQLFTINVLFACFCLLQALVVKASVPEFRGLTYLFSLLYLSFLAVSVLDYFIHRRIPETLTPEHSNTES